ncbi:SDR family oxidoreductase [Cedecea neteri]|uniref:SDR family oxidoreductase n=1 Tax=Cedecea neteri TaxID=158822 RepID=UPI002AA68793|nr:SDR family oxidoreductase [Cedecea neteri]WPU25467.1 SDR family oxidoreductase [Cedecea neteri]
MPLSHEVIVVIGSGSIAQAIARRVGIGKHILLADITPENSEAAQQTLQQAGFRVSTAGVDVRSRESIQKLVGLACDLGEVKGVIHTAGLSPSQAAAQDILRVDLFGTAVVFQAFGQVIGAGGSGVVIGSQSSHRLDVDALTQAEADELATLPPEQLLELPRVKAIDDSLYAYQLSKRGNALRVMAEAVKWGRRGARINCISAGIVYTPLAYDELHSAERGEFYRNMLAKSPAGRGGTPDEIGALAEFLFGPNGAYISGSDILIDGGVTAAYKYGDLKA